MATQSTAPPNPTYHEYQNPASEVERPIMEGQDDAKAEATKENSTTSVFVNSEPMREEQVQNAVKFLSHPKVRGSPVIYRRSFLERKGLTKEEIDEAFRRAPDLHPTASSVQPDGTNQDGQLKSSSNTQPQATNQTLQPAAATPAGVISNLGTLTKSRFHWSHAFLAVGLLAVSGAGTAILFKNAIVPRLKSWIRKIVLEEEDLVKKTNTQPTLAEETTAAAKAAAAAAADVARASREMLTSKTEEKRYFEELMNRLDVQVQEIKSMSNAIKKLEGQSTPGRIRQVEQDHGVAVTSSRQSNASGKAEFDLHSVRSSSPSASVEPSVAPHPKSYMEIMAMIQRGERPPNIREINDLPPNPNQQISHPRLAPRSKPWEVTHVQNSSGYVPQTQESSDGYHSKLQENGFINQSNGDNSMPSWQRKNVRITEIETEDGPTFGSSGVLANERPMQRSWVPPQPPPVTMPEAAAAIRQPKKPLFQKEQLADDQSVSHPSDITDELLRITKLSESGGVVEENGGSSKLNTGEIQVENETFE